MHGLETVGGFHGLVAVVLEDFAHQLAQRFLAFDYQNGFLSGADFGLFGLGRRLRGARVGDRKEDVETGALADHALNFNPALVLIDHAENGRQAQAEPLPTSLVVKKGSNK